MKKMNKIGSSVTDKATFLKYKTEEFIRNVDYKINIDKMEEEIEELYMDIGEMVCRYLDAGEKINLTGGVNEKYKRICMLKKNILSRKKVVNANIRSGIYCENCGEVIDRGHNYCYVCGKKL